MKGRKNYFTNVKDYINSHFAKSLVSTVPTGLSMHQDIYLSKFWI